MYVVTTPTVHRPTVLAWTSPEASLAPYRLHRPHQGGRPHWSRPRSHPRYQRALRLARHGRLDHI